MCLRFFAAKGDCCCGNYIITHIKASISCLKEKCDHKLPGALSANLFQDRNKFLARHPRNGGRGEEMGSRILHTISSQSWVYF
jgi:hypothetical protein